MHIITAVKQAVKNKDRANLELDGAFWIGIDKNLLVDQHLFKGKEISEQEKVVIEKLAKANKEIFIASAYIARRIRSIKEVKDYLMSKRELDKPEAESIVEKLIEKGILSDESYARAYIQSKLRLKNYGENKIRNQLMLKGVSKEIISEVLKSFTDKEEYTDENISKIKAIIAKMLSTIKSKSPADLKSKIIRRLVSRGYKFADIKQALSQD